MLKTQRSHSKKQKNRLLKRVLLSLLLCSLIAIPGLVNAFGSGVDKNSIFRGARNAASLLDLELFEIRKALWRKIVQSPSEDTVKEYPLLTKVGMGVSALFRGSDERIHASCIIMNLDGFLVLTLEQRKQLVYNSLELIKNHIWEAAMLVDPKTNRLTGKIIENKHIKLSIHINKDLHSIAGERLRFLLPLESGVGLAAYNKGQFIFSYPYFLKLQVKNGYAVPGDKTYTLEPENLSD
jgi:hypothetical protein